MTTHKEFVDIINDLSSFITTLLETKDTSTKNDINYVYITSLFYDTILTHFKTHLGNFYKIEFKEFNDGLDNHRQSDNINIRDSIIYFINFYKELKASNEFITTLTHMDNKLIILIRIKELDYLSIL